MRYLPMEQPMMMMQPVLVNAPRRMSAISTGYAEMATSGLAIPPNVLRMPRGPDKGKGFQRWCKNRMQPAASAASAAQAAPAPQPTVTQPAAAAQPVQRKSRAIPIVAPPTSEAGPKEAEAEVEVEAEGAFGGAPASPALVNPDNNLVVNLENTSSDSDEGHFSDHDLDLDNNERSR